MRFGLETAESAHAATFDLLGEFADAGNAGGDMAADDGGDRFAAAFEGHVVDLRRVNAAGFGDQAGEDVIGAAGGTTAPGDAAGIGFKSFDKIRHRFVRRIRSARR